MLFYICVQGVGENACAKKSHEKYLIALKGSGLAFPEDKLACGVQEQAAGTSTLAVQGLCVGCVFFFNINCYLTPPLPQILMKLKELPVT